MPGYLMQSRGRARTPLPRAQRLHLSARQTSHFSSMRHGQSGLGTRTANHPKFIPPYLVQGNVGPSHFQNQSRPSAWLQIVSVSIFLCYSLGVCYWAQLCGQTQEWLTDRGTSTCASRKSPPPVNTLAWLGTAWIKLLFVPQDNSRVLQNVSFCKATRRHILEEYFLHYSFPHFPLTSDKTVGLPYF